MSTPAHAGAPLAVFTTVAMKGVLEELVPEFERAHSRAFAMTFGPGGVTLERVRSGQICDVVISAPATLDMLTKEGHLVAGSTATVARSRVGVAVRTGAPRPKIDTVDNFKQALIEARSVAYTNPATGAASGMHFVKVMEQLGVTDLVNAKAKFGGGGPVAEFVARGEAELAIQQICEHMLVQGVDVVGLLPDELQQVTTLGAAVHRKAAAPEAAKALVQLLTSARTQARMRGHGLEPAVGS